MHRLNGVKIQRHFSQKLVELFVKLEVSKNGDAEVRLIDGASDRAVTSRTRCGKDQGAETFEVCSPFLRLSANPFLEQECPYSCPNRIVSDMVIILHTVTEMIQCE